MLIPSITLVNKQLTAPFESIHHTLECTKIGAVLTTFIYPHYPLLFMNSSSILFCDLRPSKAPVKVWLWSWIINFEHNWLLLKFTAINWHFTLLSDYIIYYVTELDSPYLGAFSPQPGAQLHVLQILFKL